VGHTPTIPDGGQGPAGTWPRAAGVALAAVGTLPVQYSLRSSLSGGTLA